MSDINMALDECFENLANAVVIKAANDYVEYGTKLKLHRGGHFRFSELEINEAIRLYEDAKKFLKSKRLIIYTKVDGGYLINKLNIQIDNKIKEYGIESEV